MNIAKFFKNTYLEEHLQTVASTVSKRFQMLTPNIEKVFRFGL